MKRLSRVSFLVVGLSVCLMISLGVFSFGASKEFHVMSYWSTDSVGGQILYDYGVKKFEAKHPELKIKWEVIPWDQLNTQLILRSAAGTVPSDVSWQGVNLWPEMVFGGHLMSLNKFVTEDVKKDFVPLLFKSQVFHGEVYGIPTTTDIRVHYYRKDFFREAGLDPKKPARTWDDVTEYGKKLTKDKDGDGIVDQWGFGFISGKDIHTSHIWFPLLHGGGGTPTDENGNAAFNSQAGINAATFYRDCVTKYKISPPGVIGVKYPDIERGYIEGKYAMAHLGSWSNAPRFLEALGKEKYDFAPIPIPQGGEDATVSGFWSWCIPTRSRYPELAWEFIQIVNSKEVLLKRAEKTNALSTRISLLDEPEYQGGDVERMTRYMVKATHPFPSHPLQSRLTDGIADALS